MESFFKNSEEKAGPEIPVGGSRSDRRYTEAIGADKMKSKEDRALSGIQATSKGGQKNRGKNLLFNSFNQR